MTGRRRVVVESVADLPLTVTAPSPDGPIVFQRQAVRRAGAHRHEDAGQAVEANGASRDVAVPSPTCPNWLLPHPHTLPSGCRPRECAAPAETAGTPATETVMGSRAHGGRDPSPADRLRNNAVYARPTTLAISWRAAAGMVSQLAAGPIGWPVFSAAATESLWCC